jgi:thioredoxin reductase
LIQRRKDFRADAALVEEVTRNKKVTVHTEAVVRAFLGKEKLTGVKLESVEDKIQYELDVDGVFLEIGLLPNTDPLKGLLQLNERREVPIKRDQSTSLEGLFAAGDVTDSEEKQVSIAVGQGSLAAISAHKYLLKRELTTSKAGLKEPWE